MRGAPFRLTLLLGALIALTPLGTDLYVPALPAIAQALHSSVELTQHTVTTFFLGMAVGRLVWGPLSDRFGRKPALVVGIALALLTSVAGAFASTVEALIGTLQFAPGAAVSGALGASFDGTAAPMTLVVAFGGTSAQLCERFLVRKLAARRQAPALPR